MKKIIIRLCSMFGHFTAPHYKIKTPGNIISARCRICGHKGYVDEKNKFVPRCTKGRVLDYQVNITKIKG
ncbi:MAG: hypothetical protein ACTSW7_01530 [Candidatus Thorarchaeota archaeon]|nr:hypothetical protein [Thermoplasmatales archaeon]